MSVAVSRLAPPTVVELLLQRAADRPDLRLFTFLDEDGQEAQQLTCGELDRRARAIAAQLQERFQEDARELGISHWTVVPCLALTFLFGPAGWLLYTILRSIRRTGSN